MGGTGSGRTPDVMKMAREQFQNNAVQFNDVPLVLPNLSGVQKEALRTDTGLTAGSVLFADTDGTITQDYNAFRYNSTNKVLTFAGESTESNGLKFMTDFSAANVSSRILFAEDAVDQNLFGFSLVFAGQPNPTFNGTTMTATANTFNIFHHANSAAGTAALTIDRTTGNTGIKTPTPDQALEVVGQLQVTHTDGAGDHLTIQPFTDGNTYFNAYGAGAGEGGFYFRVNDGANIAVRFNNDAPADSLTVDALGVGIGTTTPGALLDVAGDARIRTGTNDKVDFDGGDILIVSTTDAVLRLTEAGDSGFRFLYDGDGTNNLILGSGVASTYTPRLTIERDTGNVAIGTMTPSTTLHVSGSSGITFNRTGNFGTFIDFQRGGSRKWQFHAGIESAIDNLFALRTGTTPDNRFFWHTSGSMGMVNHTNPTSVDVSSMSGSMFISGGALWYKGFAGTYTLVANS